MAVDDVLRWIGSAGAEDLARIVEAARLRLELLDVCEHGVRAGYWCGLCALWYEQQRTVVVPSR